MKHILFGQTQDKVSQVVMGLMRIHGMTVDQVYALVSIGLENGIDFLDNADIYGGGGCEEILGDVFKAHPDLRDKVFVQTKCGIHREDGMTYFDFSKPYILDCVDRSLRRMKTDRIDCLLLHRPDALMEPEEVNDAFETLQRQGKVRNFGVSNQNPMQMRLLGSKLSMPICANQLQLSCAFTPAFDAGFNVNMQNSASVMHDGGVFEYCRLNDMAIQSWSSLQYGYFEGVFLGNDRFGKLNDTIDSIAKEKGVTSSTVALSWILRYPAKMQTVIGTTKPERIVESAKAADLVLSRKEWYEIYLAAGNRLP